MKKYDNYKDSGIEWIGEIPEHWNVKKLKFISKICNGQDQKAVLDDNGIYPIFGSGGIFGKANSFLFDQPSVLLGRKGTIDKPQYVEEPFWTVDTSYYTKIKDGFSTRLFYYLCTTINFELYKYGSAIPSMTQGHLNEIKFSIPNTFHEQNQIANYLDRKTAQIDNLIAKKEQFITLLQEERTAVIKQAVTKGLDLKVKMKNSCIEWLGEIPQHWEVKKLKYFADVVLGKMLTPEDKGNYHLKQYLRAKNIEWEKPNIDDVKEMWFSINEMKNFRIKKDDLLVSEGGEVGRTCIWNDEIEECYIQNSVHKVTILNDGDPNYFLNQFILFGKMGHFDAIVNKISIAHLTKEKLKDVSFFYPPIKEQKEISNHILTRTQEIDTIISKAQQEIELLKEYKTALINEVVTGKVDVREEKNN
jgi:type I restriction enzyme S subunit